jgi:hypothetical protein
MVGLLDLDNRRIPRGIVEETFRFGRVYLHCHLPPLHHHQQDLRKTVVLVVSISTDNFIPFSTTSRKKKTGFIKPVSLGGVYISTVLSLFLFLSFLLINYCRYPTFTSVFKDNMS